MHGRNAKSTALRNAAERIRACIPLFDSWNLRCSLRVISTEAAKLSSQDENQALPAL
jgi:hypothetical protein